MNLFKQFLGGLFLLLALAACATAPTSIVCFKGHPLVCVGDPGFGPPGSPDIPCLVDDVEDEDKDDNDVCRN